MGVRRQKFTFAVVALALLSANAHLNSTEAFAEGSSGATGTTGSTGTSTGGTAAVDPFSPTQLPQSTTPNFTVPAGFSNVFAGCGQTPIPQCSNTIPESASGAVENCDLDMVQVYQTASMQAAQAGQVMANLQCKSNAIQAFKSEIACVNNAAKSLANLIGSLQNVITQNIHNMQKNVKQLVSMERDREAQLKDTEQKLNGNEKTGQKGLNQMAMLAQDTLTKMPDSIQGIKEAYTGLDNKKEGLEEAVKLRKTALAVECFNKDKSPTYISQKGGSAETALTYAVNMYKNKLMEGSGGMAEQSEFRKTDAEAKGKALDAALQQWFANLPNDSKITLAPSQSPGKDGQAVDPNAALSSFLNQNRTLITPDLLKQLEASLKGYDSNGLSISKFVVSTMQTCYENKSKQVEQERTSKSTQIGMFQEQIKMEERSIRNNVSKMMTDYGLLMQDSMSALTGENMPVNTSNCTAANQTAKGQMQCLDDAQKNLKGLVEGSIPQSVVNMVIKGNNPASNIGLQCAGLKGCQQKLKNLATNVESERQKVKEFKESYVLQSNQSLETFAKQVSSQLSPQMVALYQRMDTVSLLMAGLGVKSLIDPKGVEQEGWDKEGEELAGLYKVPKSTLNLIGGQMSPPMMDVSKNPFNEVISGMTERMADISKAQADVAKVITEINQIPGKCQAQKKKEALEAAKEARAEQRQQTQDNISNALMQRMAGGEQGGAHTSSGDGGSDRMCDTYKSHMDQLESLAAKLAVGTSERESTEKMASEARLTWGRSCSGGGTTGAQASSISALASKTFGSGNSIGSSNAGSIGFPSSTFFPSK